MSYNQYYNDSEYIKDEEAYEVPWVKVEFSLIICIFGLIGNFIVIFVIVVLKEYKKSVTHWYVLQLAIADSLLLLTLPFKVKEDIEGRWSLSQNLCKTKETILFLNYYASIMFLVIMSFDRYIAVCHPFHKYLQKLRTPKFAFIITVVTWILALLFCIPVMMYSYKVGIDPDCSCSYEFPKEVDFTQECINEGYNDKTIDECLKLKKKPYCIKEEDIPEYYYDEDYSGTNSPGYTDYENSNTSQEVETNLSGEATESNYVPDFITPELQFSPHCNYKGRPASWTGYLIFNFVGMFIIPFIIMTLCYSMIVYRLKSTRVRTQNISRKATNGEVGKKKKSKSSSRSDKDRRRVTIMCVILVGSFGLLWLPFHAANVAKMVGIPRVEGDDNICEVLPVVVSILGYLNSSFNPYLYIILGGGFKRRLRSAIEKERGSFIGGRSSSNSKPVKWTKQNKDETSNAPTATTKIYKEGESKGLETNRKSFDA